MGSALWAPRSGQTRFPSLFIAQSPLLYSNMHFLTDKLNLFLLNAECAPKGSWFLVL